MSEHNVREQIKSTIRHPSHHGLIDTKTKELVWDRVQDRIEDSIFGQIWGAVIDQLWREL